LNISLKNPIETGSFAPWTLTLWPPTSIRVVDWNINRGSRLSGIIDFLHSANADLILLQESDLNAKRTQRLNVGREIAQKLRMNYIFGCEFQELTQGSRNSPAYHGQVTLSPWLLSNPRILRFQKQSSFWRPRWFLPDVEPLQERLGGRIALITDVGFAGRHLVSYNLHLESRGDANLRQAQLRECLSDANRYTAEMPVVLAGDMNFDVARTDLSAELGRKEFNSPFAAQQTRTTPPKSLFDRGSRIDWVFTRGPITATHVEIHNQVDVSDHYPLSLTLSLQ